MFVRKELGKLSDVIKAVLRKLRVRSLVKGEPGRSWYDSLGLVMCYGKIRSLEGTGGFVDVRKQGGIDVT
jgi:hypothetical protein